MSYPKCCTLRLLLVGGRRDSKGTQKHFGEGMDMFIFMFEAMTSWDLMYVKINYIVLDMVLHACAIPAFGK